MISRHLGTSGHCVSTDTRRQTAISPTTERANTERPSIMPVAAPCQAVFQRMAGLLLALLLVLMPTGAKAACSFDNPPFDASSPVNYTLPTTITIPFDLSPGAVLGSPVDATPSNPPNVTCDANTPYGVQNLVGGAPTGGSNFIYPTSVPGVGYQLIHDNAPQFMGPYPGNSAPGGDSTYSVGTTLQLVQTGPIVNGSVLPAGTLSNWQWGGIVPEYFVLTNPVRFVAQACVVNTTSIAVTLPTVSTTAFQGTDTTAGTTPFSIQLTCPSGSTATVSITFDAQNGYPPGYRKKLLKNTGNASGLGVELLDKDATTPIVFTSKTSVGTSPAGGWTLPYFARYHATAATVGAGSVKAAATFTLSYQ